MKVIYEKTIAAQLQEIRHRADLDGSRIEKVVLTSDEMRRLERELWWVNMYPADRQCAMMFGMRLEEEAA